MGRTEITAADRDEVRDFIKQHWHSPLVMSHGRAFYPHEEHGLIERRDGKIAGLVTYHINDEGMEILTLNSTLEGQRIGTSLMLDVMDRARCQGINRIWLTTTNAHMRAIGFYQRLGFRMTQINPGAVDEARKTKPEIPETGDGGIPMRDEVVMELLLEPYLETKDQQPL